MFLFATNLLCGANRHYERTDDDLEVVMRGGGGAEKRGCARGVAFRGVMCGVFRHFTAVAMSVELTRSLDATRVLTSACMAAIADAIVRHTAWDLPCRFTLHMQVRWNSFL
jgi:hypothetical protein